MSLIAGDRAAGRIILDDLLAHTGVLVGRFAVETCEHGVRILDRVDAAGNVQGDAAAYQLAARLPDPCPPRHPTGRR